MNDNEGDIAHSSFFLHVTGLHGNSAGDTSNYGCKEFKDFGDCSPIEFSHKLSLV